MAQQDTDNLTDKQHHWFKHIQASESAGQGMKAYAGQQDIDIKTLYHWKKVLVKKGVLPRTRKPRTPAVTFQRAQIIDKSTADNQWNIRLPNGIQIGWAGAVNEAELALVLKTVVRLT